MKWLLILLIPSIAMSIDITSLEEPDLAWEALPKHIEVTVTVYHAVVGQTDSTPHILADGTKIDIDRAGEYKYCALSRDLLERWGGEFAYGDTIYLEGVGKFSGAWIVKDTMNKRWTNRIDLLVDLDTRPYKWETALITRSNDERSSTEIASP